MGVLTWLNLMYSLARDMIFYVSLGLRHWFPVIALTLLFNGVSF